MHHDRPHAHGFHEHDVDQQMAKRFGMIQQAAAELDDGDLVAELANPANASISTSAFSVGVSKLVAPARGELA